jgi:hypothetical protein
MIFLKFKYSIAAFCIVLGLLSCNSDQIGPDLKGASSEFEKNINFEIYQNDSSDFDTLKFAEFDEAYFNVTKFNEEVTWEVSIVGLTSGAIKLIKGTSNSINSKNATWLYGRATNEYFFQENEEVLVQLNVLGLDTTYSIENMKFGPEFDWHLKTLNGIKHIVIDKFNFDTDTGPDTLLTRQGLNDASADQNDPEVYTGLSEFRVEGLKSFHMNGTDYNNNGWLASKNHERLLELLAAEDLSGIPISADVSEDNLFISAFIYGNPDFPASTVEFKVYEADAHFLGKTREEVREFANNKESLLNQPKSDGWIYDVIVDWFGWKQVSIPYSAFRAANDPNLGGGGDRIKQPERISAMAISLLSYPEIGEYVETYVDFISITENGFPQFKK